LVIALALGAWRTRGWIPDRTIWMVSASFRAQKPLTTHPGPRQHSLQWRATRQVLKPVEHEADPAQPDNYADAGWPFGADGGYLITGGTRRADAVMTRELAASPPGRRRQGACSTSQPGGFMNIVRKTVRRIERLEALDKVAKPLAGTVGRAVRPRVVRNLLSGTYLGEPQHPVLTDLPIGAWVMSALLDAVGGPAAEAAADLLVAAGVVAAVPTVAAGLNDWSDTAGPETRVGLVHATLNTTALSLYLASLIARARGRRRSGKALGLAGLGVLTGGAYLGGHLSFVMGVDVNRTAWEQRPDQWTPVLADTELADGTLRNADAAGAAVLLYRTAGTVYALASTCSHMGGPLEEGTISDGCVTCPWHGSTFRFADGTIVRGPASTPQPCYQTRIQDGRIEVRAFT
jgi:nitrite reductase/ring-hydroxylating ferredoxin subunit